MWYKIKAKDQSINKVVNFSIWADSKLHLNKVLFAHKMIDIKIVTGKSPELQKKIINEILGPHKFDYYIPPNNPGVMYVNDKEII